MLSMPELETIADDYMRLLDEAIQMVKDERRRNRVLVKALRHIRDKTADIDEAVVIARGALRTIRGELPE